MNPMKLLVVATLMLTAVACKKDDTPDPNVIFKATLTGAGESTPNNSTATGTATLTYNQTTKIFNVVVTYTGLTPSAGHIHKAPVGTPGPIVFPFTSLASPINYTSPVLDATQEADLMNNLHYVNLHTPAFPAGEIRGQLIKQ